jgi:hypothetical protein
MTSATKPAITGDRIDAEFQVQSEMFARADETGGEDALANYLDNMGIELDGLHRFCEEYARGNAEGVDPDAMVPAMMRAFTLGVELGRRHRP